MPVMHKVRLHQSGPALWPDHKSLAEVLELRGSTPENVWESTYQGNPQPPGGALFRPEWWGTHETRADVGDRAITNRTIARWQSWDTAMKDDPTSAYSVCVTGDLLPDYRLLIRHVYRQRLTFPDLPATIERTARQFNGDEKLRGVLIEDRASGISAYQTLMASSESWMAHRLVPFSPSGSKIFRAEQASVWCRNGCVLLPIPNDAATWLFEFEDELFTAPGSEFMDQVDALTQLILYLEHLLAEGWRFREGKS